VKLVLVVGIILTCSACAWLSVITLCHLDSYLVVISAAFLGAGCAVLLVSAISMATEVIGSYSVSFSVLTPLQGRQFLSKLGRVPPFPFPSLSPSPLPSFHSLPSLPLPFPFPSLLSQSPLLIPFPSPNRAKGSDGAL